MPYIKREERTQYQTHIMAISKILAANNWSVGHVNFVFSSILKRWWRFGGNYATINSIRGVLTCIADEFYRRTAVPYENVKKKENGDI